VRGVVWRGVWKAVVEAFVAILCSDRRRWMNVIGTLDALGGIRWC
jgi:hypothetical protein